ncbi:MAG: alpha/beta hydrolase [Propionibacteriales bacterium]|nr:alpha/beta hydrolase [Propionibacteriales bacterium]
MTEIDVLGSPYTRETIEMPADDEGEVVATLVRRPADPSAAGKFRGAVLHVHGFSDYFFQTEMAEFYTGLGFDFYALDLRKHGRSLLPHQTPNFCLDLAEYFPDLDEAVTRITNRDAHQRLVISGHSTGALIASLWSATRSQQGRRPAVGLVLNSPWLDLHGSFFLRTAGTEAINRLGQRRPYAVVPRTVTGVYAETLHRDYRGEWDFDLTWKPRESFPVRAGWLRAVRAGHRAVHRGIDVGAPVLTLCSDVSTAPQAWTDESTRSDTVLDVKQIAKWSYQLGPHVTVVRIAGALHDVLCSRKEVRERAFGEIEGWLGYALGA